MRPPRAVQRGSFRSPHGDAGVLVLAAGAAAVCAAAVLLGVLVDVSAARGRAQTAADAAALAAVASVPLVGGDGDACAAAQRLAQLNGATLATCAPPGDPRPLEAQVRVVVTPRGNLLGQALPGVTAQAAAALRPAGDVPPDRILPSRRSLEGVAPR